MGSSNRRIRIYGLAAAVGLGMLATAIPAGASVKGRRNTAYVLTAAAIYTMATGNTKAGLVTGAGAAYAWKRAIDEKKANEREAARRAQYCSYRSHRSSYSSCRTSRTHRSTLARNTHRSSSSCRTARTHRSRLARNSSHGRHSARGHHKSYALNR